MATTTISARAVPRFRLPEAVSVLAVRDFRVVWTGQAISMVGTWMQAIAQGLVVLELWNSPIALALVTLANALPSLLVMLFGGVLADRADKRRILIVTQVVMCALAAAVGTLVVTDRVELWMIIVATGALGIAFGYDMPAYQALLPELVPPEKISQVVALNSSTFHGSRMVGPALAGAVIAAWGLGTAYFLNAASFIAVIFSLLVIRYRPAAKSQAAHVSSIEGLKQGIRHARGRSALQTMLLITALNMLFLFPFMAILSPYYVKEVLERGSGTLGLFWAMSGVGSLIGALALIWWPTQARATRIWAAALAGPAALLVMASVHVVGVALLMAGVSSIAFSSQLGLIQSMIQESTPQEFRGRVMSLHGITFNGTMPIAGLATAGVAAGVGLPIVMAVCAVVFVVLIVWVLRFAAGGIEAVVARSRAEFEVIAADAPARVKV